MLIGNHNSVNNKLIEEISKVFSFEFVDHTEIEKSPSHFENINPKLFLVNLMDVGSNDTKILSDLRKRFPNKKIIGLHCFKSEKMISNTLEKGFDGYLSIFDFSQDFLELLETTGIPKN